VLVQYADSCSWRLLHRAGVVTNPPKGIRG